MLLIIEQFARKYIYLYNMKKCELLMEFIIKMEFKL